MQTVNFDTVRKDFPILQRLVNGKPLVYLDNAASSQKPVQVIEAIRHYYSFYNANVHRGVHTLSQEGTEAFELARRKVKDFISAASEEEVIFTSGTTDAINLVAFSFGETFVKSGSEILVSALEHHSNIVPWQLLAERKQAVIKVIPMDGEGMLDVAAYEKLITERTVLVAVNHISNALGTVNPIREMIAIAHRSGVPVLVDGAQAVPHMAVNVRELDCDFYAFSGHKMCGPTGIGILYGKKEILEKLPPYRGGGEMIREVTWNGTTYNDLPFRFEAGTPHIEGAIALGAAIDYLTGIGMEQIAAREHELLLKAMNELSEIPGIVFYGKSPNKASVISFLAGDIHPYDIGVILDKMGIAVRTGHHCAQPIMDYFGIPGTVRASLAFYNNEEDIRRLGEGLRKAIQMLG